MSLTPQPVKPVAGPLPVPKIAPVQPVKSVPSIQPVSPVPQTKTVSLPQPVTPVTSVSPVNSVQAVSPVQPVQAVTPVQPVQAVKSVSSGPEVQAVSPVKSVSSGPEVEAVKPVQPVSAVKPVQAVSAVNPVQPVSAVKPVQPVSAVPSGSSAQTVKSVPSIQPISPVQPVSSPIEEVFEPRPLQRARPQYDPDTIDLNKPLMVNMLQEISAELGHSFGQQAQGNPMDALHHMIAGFMPEPGQDHEMPVGVLTEDEIKQRREQGTLVFFDPVKDCTSQIEFNAVRLTLGECFFRHETRNKFFNPQNKQHVKEYWGKSLEPLVVDRDTEQLAKELSLKVGDKYFLLRPNETILAHTQEFIGGEDVITLLGSLPYLSRFNITVARGHLWHNVGQIDRFCLQITNHNENIVLLTPGMDIAQAIFIPVRGTVPHKREPLRKIVEAWTPEGMLN